MSDGKPVDGEVPVTPARAPRGWFRKRWVAVALLVAAALCVAWLLRSGELRRIAREFVNSQIAGSTNMRISWRTLYGNPLRRVDVGGLRVELRDPHGRWHLFLEARRVTADASLPQLLKAARLSIRADHPVVWLTVDSSGAVLLPTVKSSKGGGGGGGLEVAPLEVQAGSLRVALAGDSTREWGADVNGRFRVELGRAERVHVERLSFRMPRQDLRVDSLAAELELGDRGWIFRRLGARGPGFSGRAEGRYASDRDFLIDAHLDSLSSGVVSPWLSGDLPRAAWAGHARLAQAGRRLAFETEGRFTRSSLGPAGLAARGEWRGPRVRLDAFTVELDGAQARGAGEVQTGGSARLEGTFSGVEPEQLTFLPPSLRVRRTDLAGSAVLNLEWNRAGLQHAFGRAELADPLVSGQRLQRVAGLYDYRPDLLRVDSLAVRGAPGRASGWFSVGPRSALRGSGALDVALDSLDALARATGERISGRLAGEWGLQGSLEQPDVKAQLDLRAFRWRGIAAASAVARVNWQGPGVAGLTAQASLTGLRVGDVSVEGAELDAAGGPVTRFRLTAAHRDSSITGQGQVDWRARLLTVDAGTLVLGEKRWDQRGTSRLSWAGDSLAWRDVNWGSPDGDSIAISGRFRPEGGRLQLDFHAWRWDLHALLAHFLGSHTPRGLLSGEVHVDGSLDAPRATLNARVDGGVFEGHPLEQVQADGTLQAGRLDLAHWEIRDAGSLVDGRLAIDFPRLRARGLRAFTEPGDSLFRSAVAEIRADLRPLDLSALGDFSESLRTLSGKATGWITLRGSLAAPHLEAGLTGEDVSQADLKLGRMELSAVYDREVLQVQQASSEVGGVASTVRGRVPCRLSLDPVGFRWLDREMDLRVDVPQGDLGLLAGLFPDVLAYASGMVKAEAHVTGSPQRPRFVGQATLADATVRLSGREEVFRKVSGEVVFEDSLVRVTAAHAETGRRGLVDGSGTLQWDRRGVRGYHFDVEAREAAISDQVNYSGLVRGSLRIDPLGPGNLNPLVHGTVVVQEGLLLPEFGQTPPTLQETREKPALRWYYDLDLEVPGNLWWKNSQANIEVAGTLRARNTGGFNEGQGQFDIQRGTFDVYDTSFRIEDSPVGTVVFNGPIENPTLTLTASAQVGGLSVLLTVPGTSVFDLNKPGKFRFSTPDAAADAPSEARIVNYLTMGRFTGQSITAQDTVRSGGLTAPLGNLVLRRVQRELGVGFSRFVDVFELGSDPTAGRVNVSTLGLGKYLTPDLFVRYGQALNSSGERDVSLEWRLSKMLFLKGQSVRRSLSATGTGVLETNYNLDLKLKLDY